ncbi:MAG: Aldehyde dehydrogenase [Nitrosopumilales archaeon]|nr:MAG: Aldehyde dehydrogenase [Nitrosopumilales archaeon]
MFENEYTFGKAVANNSISEFDEKFEQGFSEIEKNLGKEYPIIINGEKIFLHEKFDVKSPSDTRIVIGRFPQASKEDTIKAIENAKNSFLEWSSISYKKRAQIFKDCADLFSKQKYHLAALTSLENGKNRIEAIGEVDESIDFMRFYAYQLEICEGFEKETPHPNPKEKTKTILKPFGVWGIISPFNFPSAIAIGMTTGALITGNTAVLKPASNAPLSSFKFVDAIYKKLPQGAINFVTGPGDVVGKTLFENPLVSGIAFTGSKEVGMSGFQKFIEKKVKPFVSEMGGKNPVIVTEHADLENAANGVMHAAFGYGGQKCSACSRIYVQKNIADKFIKILSEKTNSLKIGLPWKKEINLGPVINKAAKDKFQSVINLAKKDGQILKGGSVIQNGDFEYGYYVEPTIITKLPSDHKLVKEELFLPILYVDEYETFDESIKLANDTEYGLTAGIFSEKKEEIEKFFNEIQAGTVYANRASSATTGALVQSQPFVGWKSSGISRKGAGGEQYLQQFLRAQTQTRCD